MILYKSTYLSSTPYLASAHQLFSTIYQFISIAIKPLSTPKALYSLFHDYRRNIRLSSKLLRGSPITQRDRIFSHVRQARLYQEHRVHILTRLCCKTVAFVSEWNRSSPRTSCFVANRDERVSAIPSFIYVISPFANFLPCFEPLSSSLTNDIPLSCNNFVSQKSF